MGSHRCQPAQQAGHRRYDHAVRLLQAGYLAGRQSAAGRADGAPSCLPVDERRLNRMYPRRDRQHGCDGVEGANPRGRSGSPRRMMTPTEHDAERAVRKNLSLCSMNGRAVQQRLSATGSGSGASRRRPDPLVVTVKAIGRPEVTPGSTAPRAAFLAAAFSPAPSWRRLSSRQRLSRVWQPAVPSSCRQFVLDRLGNSCSRPQVAQTDGRSALSRHPWPLPRASRSVRSRPGPPGRVDELPGDGTGTLPTMGSSTRYTLPSATSRRPRVRPP